MFSSVVNATLNLSLFRSGPQDFPFHAPLTGVLVPLAALISYLVYSTSMPPAFAAMAAVVKVMGAAFVARFYLVLRLHPERFVQTFHSLLVVDCLLTLLAWVPFSEFAPEFQRLMENPEAVQAGDALNVPSWAIWFTYGLTVWRFAVYANIFRHAGDTRIGGGIIVSILLEFTTLSMLMFFMVLMGLMVQGAAG